MLHYFLWILKHIGHLKSLWKKRHVSIHLLSTYTNQNLFAQQLNGVTLTWPKSRRAGCQLTGSRAKGPTPLWQTHCGACVTWCCETLWTSVRHTTCNLLDTHCTTITSSPTAFILKLWSLERILAKMMNLIVVCVCAFSFFLQTRLIMLQNHVFFGLLILPK